MSCSLFNNKKIVTEDVKRDKRTEEWKVLQTRLDRYEWATFASFVVGMTVVCQKLATVNKPVANFVCLTTTLIAIPAIMYSAGSKGREFIEASIQTLKQPGNNLSGFGY